MFYAGEKIASTSRVFLFLFVYNFRCATIFVWFYVLGVIWRFRCDFVCLPGVILHFRCVTILRTALARFVPFLKPQRQRSHKREALKLVHVGRGIATKGRELRQSDENCDKVTRKRRGIQIQSDEDCDNRVMTRRTLRHRWTHRMSISQCWVCHGKPVTLRT